MKFDFFLLRKELKHYYIKPLKRILQGNHNYSRFPLNQPLRTKTRSDNKMSGKNR